jgi:type VI secretion system secreted protein Hcp
LPKIEGLVLSRIEPVEARIMAFVCLMTVVGARQGQFKGESTDPGRTDQIPVFSFNNEVSLPFDQATGAPLGKRQHSPLVISKKLGAASPQFYESLLTGETLKTVSLIFDALSATGVETAFFKIVLVNAIVVRIRQTVGAPVGLSDAPNSIEEISFTYERIELLDIDASTAATDDWTTGT